MLTLTDYYTKWVEAYPMKAASAGEVALAIRNFTYQFGWPLRILSQMDEAFIQEVNVELGALFGEQAISLVTFHPEASTRDTVTQCFIDSMVSELVRDHRESWDLRVDLISSSGLSIPEVKFSSVLHRDAERSLLSAQTASQQGPGDPSSTAMSDKQRPIFLVTPLPLAPSNSPQSDRRAQEHVGESKSPQGQRDENNIPTEGQRRPRSWTIQHPARRIILQRIHPEDFALSV
ncbi:hypothetical protein JZ751_003562 [Albula glossodonta]|uniref:Integrase catalytic domain-containing protein n=1 Tax=Albula glossodonta TaxID=121402 RepID=A0A8T2N691_9TELE|nr:hypothetical protein JZ751_003562 [Albula glossodonta]